MAYCIAMILMFLKVFRMDGIGTLNLSSSSFIDGMCVAALAPAVITINKSVFQPRWKREVNINHLFSMANQRFQMLRYRASRLCKRGSREMS